MLLTKHHVLQDRAFRKKSSRAICRMAYLPAQVTRSMLSYSIAIPAEITTAIMKMASLTTTTTISTFIENTSDVVTRRETTTGEKGGGSNNK
jgi:hypothetical protein